MTNTQRSLAVLAVIVLLGAIYGGYMYPVLDGTTTAVSPVDTTNTTARLATITMAPATAAATTSSLINNGSDRAVTDVVAYCTSVGTSQTYLTGAGLATWSAQFSTSTTAGDAKRNTNYAGNITIATSSPWAYTSSTTDPVLGSVGRVWPTGTYLNMTFNATNTAACTIGVKYLSL